MIFINDPSDCCGCSACASVCDLGAITMSPDALGFLYPVVDEKKCIRCGRCERVCAFNENYDTSLNIAQPTAYAVRHKDIKEVEKSRSGAAFIAISDYILAHGGVVYGAGYTDHFRVVHKRAVTEEERDEFRGSKYVQSDMGRCFRRIKDDLKKGLMVLFSGTPCQTAGLNSYIGKKWRDSLYLIDIVCHGVPGPYIWRDYIAYLEEKQGSRITWVEFRDKLRFGWKAHKESFVFENGECSVGGSYTHLFYQHIMFRQSCGRCYYTNIKRPSDITIADFWGWEKTDMSFNADDKGCSLVLCNTEKGEQLFEKAKDNMEALPAELQNCLQPNLKRPSSIHLKRKAFERDYKEKGFLYILKKYGDISRRYKVEQFINKIKRRIKSLLKNRNVK